MAGTDMIMFGILTAIMAIAVYSAHKNGQQTLAVSLGILMVVVLAYEAYRMTHRKPPRQPKAITQIEEKLDQMASELTAAMPEIERLARNKGGD